MTLMVYKSFGVLNNQVPLYFRVTTCYVDIVRLCKQNISVCSNGHNRLLENRESRSQLSGYLVIVWYFVRSDIINENRVHFVHVAMYIVVLLYDTLWFSAISSAIW